MLDWSRPSVEHMLEKAALGLARFCVPDQARVGLQVSDSISGAQANCRGGAGRDRSASIAKERMTKPAAPTALPRRTGSMLCIEGLPHASISTVPSTSAWQAKMSPPAFSSSVSASSTGMRTLPETIFTRQVPQVPDRQALSM